LHLAIEELVHKNGRSAPLGVVERDYDVSLARLVSDVSANDFAQGPVEYMDVDLGPNERLACVKTGVYLFADKGVQEYTWPCSWPRSGTVILRRYRWK
jgi:hypothetical protein